MAINFPNAPTLNQTFTVDDKTWSWDGIAWAAESAPLVLPAGLPAGGTTGQALVKSSNTDYTSQWATLFGGGLNKVEVVSVLPVPTDANTLYIVIG